MVLFHWYIQAFQTERKNFHPNFSPKRYFILRECKFRMQTCQSACLFVQLSTLCFHYPEFKAVSKSCILCLHLSTGFPDRVWESHWPFGACRGSQAASAEPDWLYHILGVCVHHQGSVWTWQDHLHRPDDVPGTAAFYIFPTLPSKLPNCKGLVKQTGFDVSESLLICSLIRIFTHLWCKWLQRYPL